MKTASFFTYQGPGRISIARFAPKGITGFARYSKLAPRQEMLNMAYAEYRERYFGEILARLNPREVWEDLHKLVQDEPVLLCWECLNLPGAWCHRRMMAEWLEAELEVEIPELDLNTDTRQLALFGER